MYKLIYTFALPVLLGSLLFISCDGQPGQTPPALNYDTTAVGDSLVQIHPFLRKSIDMELMPVVRIVHEDRQGNIWFAGNGPIRYDGERIEAFTINDSLGGAVVRALVESEDGLLWFGTQIGLSVFDGNCFTHYYDETHPDWNDIWSMEIDSQGRFWVGSLGGASLFDGEHFKHFPLPSSQADPTRGVSSANMVHSIMEDSRGRLLFSNNGGIYIWEGEYQSNGLPVLEHISEADGLCGNEVGGIHEDSKGNFWLTTNHDGVCIWDGQHFTQVDSSLGVLGEEVRGFLEDHEGRIWFVVENEGVFHYDGETFNRFDKNDAMDRGAVFGISQTSDGHYWFYGNMALYRYDGTNMMEVFSDKKWWGER